MYNIDNDRPDIQRAYWLSEGQKTDNYYDKMRINVPTASYAENAEGATKLSDLVINLVKHHGCGRQLISKENLFLDVNWDKIEEFVALQVITPKGWDHPLTNSEYIVVTHKEDYCMCDISVELFDRDS
jgi:hypothetical protein